MENGGASTIRVPRAMLIFHSFSMHSVCSEDCNLVFRMIAAPAFARALLICVLLPVAAFAASPLFETTPIFPVAPGNKPNYRIPAIVQAPNGDVLIIAERRNDGIGDIGDIGDHDKAGRWH
jgi:hypothetical protein